VGEAEALAAHLASQPKGPDGALLSPLEACPSRRPPRPDQCLVSNAAMSLSARTFPTGLITP